LRAELVRAEADAAQNEADAKRYEDLATRGAAPRQLAEQHATRLRASRAAIDAIGKQIRAAESAVTVSEAGLRTAAIRGAEARTYERQIDEARAAAKLAEADVAAAATAIEMAQTQLNELELKAPIDGTVITRAAEPGRVIAAGAAVLTIVDLSNLYLRAFVPEGDIARVKLGQKAQVFLDSAPGQAVEAVVSRVDPRAMFTPENTYFRDERVKQVVGVKLRLTYSGGVAKPGMTAEGRILEGK
jgi:HlyD family secretion protein